MFWHEYWGANFPNDIEYPFLKQEEVLINIKGEKILAKTPIYSAQNAAKSAIQLGAQLVKRWEIPWGLALGLSMPDTNTAWFVVDDYKLGRFASIGVRIFEGIAFGTPISIYNSDLDQAARFVLQYGMRRDEQKFVERVLEQNPPFPVTKKTRKLWGNIDALAYETLANGLRYLQNLQDINPEIVISTSRTLEAADE